MEKKRKKILVAVDGSVYSNHTLGYLSHLFAEAHDVFMHLLYIVPAGELPMAKEWMDELDLLTTMGPATRKRYNAGKRYLQGAERQLERQGVSPERVTTQLQLSRQSVAADIIAEARAGLYDALVVGRRGLSKIEEVFMGSISQAILEKCHDVPKWIVDGQVASNRFIVPVDGSFHSLMAVDHLAYMLSGSPHAEITLFHSSAILSSREELSPEEFCNKWGRDWCEAHLGGDDYLYNGPRQILRENGFPEERIHWLHTFKGIEASRQIIREALVEDFGTIVMGRRGRDIKKGIFKRVTDRVLFMAEHVAIWIVG